MPIRPDCIRSPRNLTRRDYVPRDSKPYKVRDVDSWVTCATSAQDAAQMSIGPWELIRFNFPSLPQSKREAALEVNWYLFNYVGCNKITKDGRNFIFSSSANPGIIHLPVARSATIAPDPVLTTLAERRQSIIADTPGTFIVAENTAVAAGPNPIYAIGNYEEVTENLAIIDRYAIQYGLDVDFVKAIVWMESTHGWYDRLKGSDNETIRPMNVHARLWQQLGITRTDLANKEINIAVGVHILAKIWERTESPTFEKVATLYNSLGATSVNKYGKTVDSYRSTRPWSIATKQEAK